MRSTYGEPPPAPDDLWTFNEKEMPLKFGSPLHSKVGKRYWELAHVKGKPFVLAIADFHAPASMTWSHTALAAFLHRAGAAGLASVRPLETAIDAILPHATKGSGAILGLVTEDDRFSLGDFQSMLTRLGVSLPLYRVAP